MKLNKLFLSDQNKYIFSFKSVTIQDQNIYSLPGLTFYYSYTNFVYKTSCVNKSLDVSDICSTGCSACKVDPCTFTVQNSLDSKTEQVVCSSNSSSNGNSSSNVLPQVIQCFVGNWTYPIDYYDLSYQYLDSYYNYCTVKYNFISLLVTLT